MSEVTGVITSVSQSGTGIKIGEDWLNYSNRTPIANKPVRGQRVTVQFDEQNSSDGRASRWINSITILDNGVIAMRPGGGGGGRQRSPEELRSIVRQSVLRSAATFCAGVAMGQGIKVSSSDVLRIAEDWIDWLGQPDA